MGWWCDVVGGRMVISRMEAGWTMDIHTLHTSMVGMLVCVAVVYLLFLSGFHCIASHIAYSILARVYSTCSISCTESHS